MKLVVCNSSSNFVICKIADVKEEQIYEWKLILVYGSPYIEHRLEVWNNISLNINPEDDRIVVCGDFNQVEFIDQKLGGLKNIQGREEFSRWRMNLGLFEIPSVGTRFTWCTNRAGDERIYERLDRIYCSEGWMQDHLEAITFNLPIMVSDHGPGLLNTNPTQSRKKRLIKIDSWCLDFAEPKEIVQGVWEKVGEGSPMFRISKRLSEARFQLFKWCKEYKSKKGIVWDDFSNQCEEGQLDFSSADFGMKEEGIRKEVQEKHKVQLEYWKQIAKGKWTTLEDSNSKWFFRKAKSRKRKNEILMLKNDKGEWKSTKEGIQEIILDYFGGIYQWRQMGEEANQWEPPRYLEGCLPKISEEQADMFQRRISS